MRTGKNPREFFNAMKKKPALQAILDNLDSFSMEKLENMPGQPLWIRKILVELKKEEGLPKIDEAVKMAEIEAIADRMMQPEVEPSKYLVVQWIGSSWQMPCGMTGSMKVEINAGDYLYIVECDPNIQRFVVGMDSSIGTLSPQEWNRLLQSTEKVDIMTKPEYSAFVSEHLGKNFTDRDEIARTAGPNSYVSPEESNKAFTIIRHDVK